MKIAFPPALKGKLSKYFESNIVTLCYDYRKADTFIPESTFLVFSTYSLTPIQWNFIFIQALMSPIAKASLLTLQVNEIINSYILIF